MSELTIPEKTMLLSRDAWRVTHCEPSLGWPGKWTVVWRCEEFHGKIGAIFKSKSKPTEKRLSKELNKELLERFKSSRKCDATRVAYQWLNKKGSALPVNIKQTCKILNDSLYDLDNRIHGELFSSDGPRLMMTATHGWILGELAEIRCLVSHLTGAIEKAQT